MKRKFLPILLALCLGLTACQSGAAPAAPAGPESTERDPVQEAPAETTPTEPLPTEPEPLPTQPDAPTEAPEHPLGLTELDAQLIDFLQRELGEKSFTVSPLSLKAALALVALGAEGESEAQLLRTLGFADRQALLDWYDGVLRGMGDFEARIPAADRADCAYRVVNAIFRNAGFEGEFREEYQALVRKALAAEALSAPQEALTGAINDWVRDQTNGMIPAIVQDASQASAVLVNALYLKTKWPEAFNPSERRDFTTAAGAVVQKEFITRTEHYGYYEDADCQLVVLPLEGGVSLVLILGDGSDLGRKLGSLENPKVRVTLPKFSVETELENKELPRLLKELGCGAMFDEQCPDFDPMFTEPIHVDDVIQKAKVQVDEKGLEAAAATAVVMMRNTGLPMPEEPVDFTADHPFQFCILRGEENPELLFWGQIVD